MLEVTVKTLDSQNRNYSVPDDITVKDFKEKIAGSVNIAADKQRLIFCGRVLQDDKKLNEYDVNGKVIHLVQRPPPQVAGGASSSSAGGTSSTGGPGASARAGLGGPGGGLGHPREGSGFLLGAFTIPQDMIDPAQVQQIVQDVVSGMGEIGRNATVMSRTSEDGSSVDVHINLGQVPMQSEAQLRITQAQTMLNKASRVIAALENRAQNAPATEEDSEAMELGEPVEGYTAMVDSNGNNTATVGGNSDATGTNGSSSNNAAAASLSAGRFGEGIVNAARAAAAAAAVVAARVTAGSVFGSAASSGTDISAPSAQTASPTSQPQQPTPEAGSEQTAAQGAATASPQGATTGETAAGTQQPGSRTRRDLGPPASALAPILEEIQQLQTRLAPFLEQYQRLLREEGESEGTSRSTTDAEASRLSNRVCLALHHLSHATHAVSDLHLNTAARPRSLRARLVGPMQPSSIFHAGMPFQGQISVNAVRSPTGELTIGGRPGQPGTPATTGAASAAQDLGSSPVPSSSGPFGAAGPALLTAQSPVVFMELGPGSITIDSISTAVINDLPPPLSQSSSAPQTEQAPETETLSTEDSTSTSQSGPATSQGSRPPTTSGASTVTTSSGTTGTRASPSSVPLRALGIPAALGGSPLGGAGNTFDPCLPCNSYWAHAQSQGGATLGVGRPLRGAHSRPPSQGPTAPQVPLAGNQHDDQLHQMLNGLMTALLHQPHVMLQGQRMQLGSDPGGRPRATVAGAMPGRTRHLAMRQTPGYRYAAAQRSTAMPQSPQHRRLAPGGPLWGMPSSLQSTVASAPLPAEEVPSAGEDWIPEEQQRSSPTEAPRSGATSGTGTTPVPDTSFDSLLQRGPGAPSSTPDAQQSSLADVVQLVLNDYSWRRSLPRSVPLLEEFVREYVVSPNLLGEEFLNSVVTCVSRELTADEFVALVGGGSAERLNQLQGFLQLNVMRHLVGTPSPPRLSQVASLAVDTLLQRWVKPLVLDMLTRGAVKPKVDVEATITAFLREKLEAILLHILGPSKDTFGQELLTLIRSTLADLIVLSASCFLDEVDSLDGIFRARMDPLVTRLSLGLSPSTRVLLFEWVVSLWTTVLDSLSISTETATALTTKYLVRHGDTSPQAPPQRKSSDHSQNSNPSAMDVDAGSTEQTPAVQPAVVPKENSTTVAQEHRPTAPPLAEEGLPEVVLGSESWHASVPSEWVPIITRDIQRQRRQATQPPFSDAYFCGMPSKRRKIMNGSGTEGTVPSSLSEALHRAVQRAGVRAPRDGMEAFLAEARQNPALQAAHRLQLRQAVRERLANDPDFRPDRFPNAHRFYYSADP